MLISFARTFIIRIFTHSLFYLKWERNQREKLKNPPSSFIFIILYHSRSPVGQFFSDRRKRVKFRIKRVGAEKRIKICFFEIG